MRKLLSRKSKREKVSVRNLGNFDIYFEEMESSTSYRLRKLQNRALRTLRPARQ